ncbi:MAG TPA: indolepyruvate/phenylpyruvate decarboxylase [Steroidobacteraceae bacterium]|nr:indolepyruvate/phenylpyruvate decarboxylase [Steroidobacteraceae bacterium]
MNLSESLLEALRDHGARQVFGIPGDFVLQFFKVVEESGILPLHTLSHEPSVGFAADAAARISCAPGVAAVTYGAGALNMVNPVAAAYAEKSPLVVISGAPGSNESRAGLLLHHQVKRLDSQFEIYREITCDQARLDDPAQAPAQIARVLQSCLVQSRPVYFELPRDRVHDPCGRVGRLAKPGFDPEAVSACADEIMERISTAARPVMMVGVEVRRFGIESRVAELARRLHVPVVTSFMGRGLLATSDVPVVGTYLGLTAHPDVGRPVEESDCLLLFGVTMSDTNFGVSEGRVDYRNSILAVDRAVSMGYHRYGNIPLEALVEELVRRVADKPARSSGRPTEYPRGLVADDGTITPSDVARAVNDHFARAGRMPVASDCGDCLFTAFEFENAEIVAPGYYATMGFGVPAALGLQAATGQRPLALVGDGAFQMTGWELGNCRRNGWDPIVVVMNNQSWEMLRVFQPESKFNTLDDWHFAELAGALGGDGVRVSTRRGLAAALERAAATRGRFQLIEAMIPAGAVSPTLEGFVGALKRRQRH